MNDRTANPVARPTFRRVEPLCFWDLSASNDDVDWLLLFEFRCEFMSIEEATALRDWLNKVLP